MKRPGEILGGRFVLESSIGAGGMGTVYRAIDSSTGRKVAVKIARAERTDEDRRFASEIGFLAELSHPGIVGYVAHGATDDGRPFLAMELLEGEDLGAKLARGPLSIDEALAIVRGAALALIEPHRRGIVHRDLKPSNLFLRGGACERLVVLDFGIARGLGQQGARTATGLVVGTPEYMAPEQAQGLREVTPSADVFALGCVLYECLAGVSPFGSAHLAATLAKVLFEEPRAIESLRPDVPAPLARLLRATLAKDRDARIGDANALLRELDRLGLEQSGERAAPSSGLGRDEIELVTVLLATPSGAEPSTTLEAGPSTFAHRASEIARQHLRVPDVILERLGDGSLLVVLGRQGESPADQAMAAIRCANVLRAALPEARVAVSSARRVAGSRTAFGDAVARAGSLLSDTSGVMLDELTAALVAPADETRLLLGKPTPCVGRAQELSTLESLASTAFDERVSRAALVIAPAGVGKSRLRHELLRRLEGREHLRLSARGELLGAGSPYGVVGSALRAAFGIRAEDDLGRARTCVEEGVRRLAPALSDETTALLGELCDAPFDDESRTGLRAARQDPRVMHAKLSEACVAFLRAISERPVLFVVDDLHWGDKPSIELLGRALVELEERPFCLVAFARPEAQEIFGEIWPGRALSLALTPLHRRACQQLVERVAGDRLDAETIARIVSQSAGNALWLEELVRAADEGELEAPGTVLAMVQARIGRLEPSARRVLRAGSVFGERFPRDGVLALLGASSDGLRLDELLAELVAREIVEPLPDDAGRYRFRHALVREATYATLTDDDRKLGHRLAGEWLEHREPDPSVLAEHFLLAEESERAAPFLLRATERAYERDDFDAALRLARRASGRPIPDVVAGELASLEAAAWVMRWDWTAAGNAATSARALLPTATRGWIRAHRVLGTLAAYQHRARELGALVETVLSVEPRPEARIEYGDTLLHMSSAAAQTGLTDLARSLFERARATLADLLHRYPNMHAWQDQICCTLLRHTDDDLATQVFLLREAERLYEVVGGSRAMLILARDTLGEVLARAGQLAEAERLVRATFAEARRVGARYLVSHGALALAAVLVAKGEAVEVEALMNELLAMPGITEGFQGMARDALAQAASLRGQHEAAERFAREAIERSQHTPVRRWLMVAHLGDALVGQGRGAEAHAECLGALDEMKRAGGGGYAETSLLLSTAEAALSIGAVDSVRELVRRVRARLTEQASSFVDPTAFAEFLRTAPGTQRLRALEARLV